MHLLYSGCMSTPGTGVAVGKTHVPWCSSLPGREDGGVTTWLVEFDTQGDGPRLAIKDAIDVAGVPTTAACPVIADRAKPAEKDAPVVAAARAAGARIVGKTNLCELCRAADGVNPWTGTPVNPLDASRVPGGSSSGSAVAVAAGEADVALGTDTAGSVRIPAACCGVAGLKTTHGRVPLDGVFPLSSSLDIVGPIGRDIAAVELGMRLIEPGFARADSWSGSVGRLRPEGVTVDPAIDAAVEAALSAAELTVTDEPVSPWADAIRAGRVVLGIEGHRRHRRLLDYPDQMSERIRRRIERGAGFTDGQVDWALSIRSVLRERLNALFERHAVLALPTLTTLPPILGTEDDIELIFLTLPVNLAGLPALALPIPLAGSPLPASLQLIAPMNAEDVLLAAGATVESALR
jgi:amidase